MDINNISENIRKLRLNLRIKKYQNEIDIISQENAPWTKNRLELLQEAINETTSLQSNKTNKTKVDFTEIESHIFKKPWNRLPEVHKIMKIREFVNNNIKKSKRKQLEKELINAIQNTKLKTKNDVDYDTNKGQIVSIKCLDINNKQSYTLNL